MAVSSVQPLKDPPLVSSTIGATYSTYTGDGTNGQTPIRFMTYIPILVVEALL
jgi:hypothetical protein